MIKFREGTLQQKLFYRATKRLWDLDEFGDGLKITINLTFHSRYQNQINTLGILDKKLVKRFNKDISMGYIYDDHFPEDDTEYLDQISKPGKYLIYSKKINGPDRYCYKIMKPELDVDEDGNEKIRIDVNIYSVNGHLGPDGKPYFEVR